MRKRLRKGDTPKEGDFGFLTEDYFDLPKGTPVIIIAVQSNGKKCMYAMRAVFMHGKYNKTGYWDSNFNCFALKGHINE